MEEVRCIEDLKEIASLKDELIVVTNRWVCGSTVVEPGVYYVRGDATGVSIEMEGVVIDGDISPFHKEGRKIGGGLSFMPFPLVKGRSLHERVQDIVCPG